MSVSVDTRVTPSLHPRNIPEIEGYDDDTKVFLGPVETAFSGAYEGIRTVHDARAAAALNPTWNDAQKLIEVQGLADKVFARAAREFDSVNSALGRSISALEQELSAPVVAKAGLGIAAEIRAHVKGMETSERMAFIQSAIRRGDESTVSSVLGAPSYLSGIEDETREAYTRLWHERAAPMTAKKLTALKAAQDLIGKRSGLLFTELQKAVGMPAAKVKALRDAKSEAERAFLLAHG